jgi:hypothetical protein
MKRKVPIKINGHEIAGIVDVTLYLDQNGFAVWLTVVDPVGNCHEIEAKGDAGRRLIESVPAMLRVLDVSEDNR